jgi:hypothetical protein
MHLAQTSPAQTATRGLNRDRSPDVANLFGEVYIVYRLLKEMLRRIAGVPPGWSFLGTMFAFGVLANALRRIAAPALGTFRPRFPSLAGITFAIAVPAAILRRITGVGTSDSLLVGTTVAVCLVGPVFHATAASARAASAAVAALGRLAIGKPPGA